MTLLIRRAAGGLTALEAVFAIYVTYARVLVHCPSNGCPTPQLAFPVDPIVTVLAILLLAAGALGLWGASFAYPAGALLSFVFLLIMGYLAWAQVDYQFLADSVLQEIVGAVLAAIALGANVLGARAKDRLTEQANPMNLPVFG